MEYLKAFLAGFVSTLAFHQTALTGLHAAGLSPRAAFAMEPVKPFGVPSVVSLAFWGGLWGIALWLALRGAPDPRYWLLAAGLGAVAPTIVALLVVLPLKGYPLSAAGNPKLIVGGLILNAIWGLGVGLVMRFLR